MDSNVKEEAIKQIEWKEIDTFICKPVWDKKHAKWRVIDGYKRQREDLYIGFTDNNEYERFNTVELYVREV